MLLNCALTHVSITLLHPKRASAPYRRAVDRGPHTSRYWYNLASSERSPRKFAGAKTACNRSIALDRPPSGRSYCRETACASRSLQNENMNSTATTDANTAG